MQLGLEADMATVSAVSAALWPIVLRAVGLKRRLDKDADGAPDPGEAQGSSYLHPDLQPLVGLGLMAGAGVGAAIGLGQDLLPTLGAMTAGVLPMLVGARAVGAVRG